MKAEDMGAALVTGGGSGIGRAIALALARAGWTTVVNDIAREAGERVVAEISAAGGRGGFVEADVADPVAVRAMFDAAVVRFGRVGALVNNAGTPGGFALIADMEDSAWRRTLAVHLDGTFLCLREAARHMRVAGTGRIVNIASIAGLTGTVGSAGYAAAKAGVIGLTRTAAKEFGPHGILVNAIAPGMTATPLNAALATRGSRFVDAALAGTPTGRMADPDEIADLVVYLCSPAARSINGAVIRVDGGAALASPVDAFMREYLERGRANTPPKDTGGPHARAR